MCAYNGRLKIRQQPIAQVKLPTRIHESKRFCNTNILHRRDKPQSTYSDQRREDKSARDLRLSIVVERESVTSIAAIEHFVSARALEKGRDQRRRRRRALCLREEAALHGQVLSADDSPDTGMPRRRN